jgi:hypothetical protein
MWIVTFDRSVADSLDLIIFVGLWQSWQVVTGGVWRFPCGWTDG